MSRIRWNTNVNAPCCPGEIVRECDGASILIHVDYDCPGVAETFGWDIRTVQHPGGRCDHSATDGTVDCPACGITASQFIAEAGDWLAAHDGVTADDPGYFSYD